MLQDSYEIHRLFPTILMRKQLNIDFSKEQLKLFKSSKKRKNRLNWISEDDYILNVECMSNIKDIIMGSVQQYFTDIISAPTDIQPYITQSWLNWTKQFEGHHRHEHSNSIVSGVFYVQSDEDDKIYFSKNVSQAIKIDPTQFNDLNADMWWLPSTQMSLILFPSQLVHEVMFKQSDSTRISLSFNTFVNGPLGQRNGLNYLKL